MKRFVLLLLVTGGLVGMRGAGLAQDAPTNCTNRCDIRFAVCETAAQNLLDECLNRAQNLHDKAHCAKTFQALVDQCRTNEASCLGDCAS